MSSASSSSDTEETTKIELRQKEEEEEEEEIEMPLRVIAPFPDKMSDPNNLPTIRTLDYNEKLMWLFAGSWCGDIAAIDVSQRQGNFGKLVGVYKDGHPVDQKQNGGTTPQSKNSKTNDNIYHIACNKEGTLLVSCSDSNLEVVVWNVKNFEIINRIKGNDEMFSEPLSFLEFSPCSNFLAVSCDDYKCYIFNFSKEVDLGNENGNLLSVLEFPDECHSASWSSDGKSLVTVATSDDSDKQIFDVWDTEPLYTLLKSKEKAKNEGQEQENSSSTSSSAAAKSTSSESNNNNSNNKLVELERKYPTYTVDSDLVRPARFTHDGTMIAAVAITKQVFFFNIDNEKKELVGKEITGAATDYIYDFALMPDSSIMHLASYAGTVACYDLSTQKRLGHVLKLPKCCYDVCNDGMFVYCACADGSIYVYCTKGELAYRRRKLAMRLRWCTDEESKWGKCFSVWMIFVNTLLFL